MTQNDEFANGTQHGFPIPTLCNILNLKLMSLTIGKNLQGECNYMWH